MIWPLFSQYIDVISSEYSAIHTLYSRVSCGVQALSAAASRAVSDVSLKYGLKNLRVKQYNSENLDIVVHFMDVRPAVSGH